MDEGTLLGTVLRSANSLDILLYIRDHPGCVKSAVYRDVTRNAHRFTDHLLAAESVLRGTVPDDH